MGSKGVAYSPLASLDRAKLTDRSYSFNEKPYKKSSFNHPVYLLIVVQYMAANEKEIVWQWVRRHRRQTPAFLGAQNSGVPT
jgi:hypothetical protein